MKALVTGANGFVGRHLVPQLHLTPSVTSVITKRIELRDSSEVTRVFKDETPDIVFHLAAQSNVPNSIQDPKSTFETNVVGTQNLLEAIAKYCPKATVIFAGSGEVYGASYNAYEIVDEDAPLLPLNPYAESKKAAEDLMLQFSRSSELKIICTRPLNHIGPGQSLNFAIPSFTHQLLEVKKGLREPRIFVGDLSPRRDFTDVRDVVSAYILLFEQRAQIASGQIFNICTGHSIEMYSILQQLIEIVGVNVEVVRDPNRVRQVEVQRACASNNKLKKLGWQPRYNLNDSLRAIVADIELSNYAR